MATEDNDAMPTDEINRILPRGHHVALGMIPRPRPVTAMEALDGLTAEDIYHANYVN